MERFQVAATDEETAALEAVKERHQWQLGQSIRMFQVIVGRGGSPYRDTVPRWVVAKRRAKNRAARRARRNNR